MNARDVPRGRVLVVDDQPPNVLLLERVLRQGGYADLRSTTDPHAVLPLVAEFRPDLLLLDLLMPGLSGFEVMDQLMGVVGDDHFLPVLVLTADVSAATREKALAGGATDFLTKPFDVTEVLLRVKNLLKARFLHVQLHDRNESLEVKVRERTRDLDESRVEVLDRLALAAEFRDDDTGRHTQRVGRVSALLAQAVGLPDDEVELIRHAAPLHDVGKIGIPDVILLKAGKLTPEEFQVMATHTTIGGRILSGGRSPLLRLAEQIALTHHENWDGTGYPTGVRGEAVPIAGRVVAVADVYDALSHQRPYKVAWPVADAAAEVVRLGGTKFDPRVVEAFAGLHRAGILQDVAPEAVPPAGEAKPFPRGYAFHLGLDPEGGGVGRI